jgi:hypothetical protein
VKRFYQIFYLGLIALLFFSHRSVSAELRPAATAPASERSTVFLYGLGQERYSWYESSGKHFLATGSHLSLAYGKYHRRGLSFVQAFIVVGPFPLHSDRNSTFEYQGSGANISTAISWRGGDLRNHTHNIGSLVGLEYVGFSGKDLSAAEAPRDALAGTSLALGVFYSHLQKPRSVGTKPEQLLTSFDGVLSSLSLTLPLNLQRSDQRPPRRTGEQLMGSSLRFTLQFLIGP